MALSRIISLPRNMFIQSYHHRDFSYTKIWSYLHNISNFRGLLRHHQLFIPHLNLVVGGGWSDLCDWEGLVSQGDLIWDIFETKLSVMNYTGRWGVGLGYEIFLNYRIHYKQSTHENKTYILVIYSLYRYGIYIIILKLRQ